MILLLYPHSLFTPSFLLTFMSLIFIVMSMNRFFPAIAGRSRRVLTWSCSAALPTMAAVAGTAPIVVHYFHGMNPLCLVHNLVTAPLTGIAATTLSIVGMLGPWLSPLLVVAGRIVEFNEGLLRLLDFGFLYPLVRPTFAEALLYYCLLVALLHVDRKPVAVLLVWVLIPLSVLQAHAAYRQRFNTDLRVHFIDVGLGDATLIEAPGGVRILIDGGGYPGSDFDTGRQVVAPFLLLRKIRTIDWVINTHPHADHIGGLPFILEHFAVSRLATSGLFPGEPRFEALMAVARRKGVRHEIWKTGDGITQGDFRLSALYPPTAVPGRDLNACSLVLRVRHGARSLLLPADIPASVEEGLVLSGAALKSDVLRLSHHGSALSNSPAFVYAVRPELAIMSTAEGVIRGLPGGEALARFRALAIPVLRTDRDGLVEVASDGRRMWWTSCGRGGGGPQPLGNAIARGRHVD